MKERKIRYNYYAYSYNSLNDLYIIRGVDGDYYTDVAMEKVPEDLIEKIVFEEYLRSNRIYSTFNRDWLINYSENHCYAIIDFNGRYFTKEQIDNIINGKKVEYKDIRAMSPAMYSTIDEPEKGKSFLKKLTVKFSR